MFFVDGGRGYVVATLWHLYSTWVEGGVAMPEKRSGWPWLACAVGTAMWVWLRGKRAVVT
jgi:hypothetical protein